MDERGISKVQIHRINFSYNGYVINITLNFLKKSHIRHIVHKAIVSYLV